MHCELKKPELRPSGRLIVVGDVHGCCDELDLLLKECNATEHDNVVLVGDLVNKGPKSVEVRWRSNNNQTSYERFMHQDATACLLPSSAAGVS